MTYKALRDNKRGNTLVVITKLAVIKGLTLAPGNLLVKNTCSFMAGKVTLVAAIAVSMTLNVICNKIDYMRATRLQDTIK